MDLELFLEDKELIRQKGKNGTCGILLDYINEMRCHKAEGQ